MQSVPDCNHFTKRAAQYLSNGASEQYRVIVLAVEFAG
jgi:hypothetical protein